MTRDETKTILATMSAVYPINLMPPVTEMTVNVWFQLLQDVPFKLASAAVAAWLQTEKYPPTIASIREMVTRQPQSLTAEQAWTAVQLAVKDFGHTEKDRAQQTLGDLWRLVGADWTYYCTLPVDQISNEKARFIRMYTNDAKREQNIAQIAAPIRQMLGEGMKRLEASGD